MTKGRLSCAHQIEVIEFGLKSLQSRRHD